MEDFFSFSVSSRQAHGRRGESRKGRQRTAKEESKEDDPGTPDVDRFSRIRLRSCQFRCSCETTPSKDGRFSPFSLRVDSVEKEDKMVRRTIRRTATPVFEQSLLTLVLEHGREAKVGHFQIACEVRFD